MGLLKNLLKEKTSLDGITAAIIYKNKVLLLKRLNIPIILNPGAWTFVQGSRDGSEDYFSCAYREIYEETGLSQDMLKLACKPKKQELFNRKNPKLKWENMFFIFYSNGSAVKKNYESSGTKWASIDDILKENGYDNIFSNPKTIASMLSSAMKSDAKVV